MGMTNVERDENGVPVVRNGEYTHEPYVPVYDDGRTKQAFKEDTEINTMLRRHQVAGTMSHLEAYGGEYGDFAGVDLLTAHQNINRGRQIFDALPSEVRKEFRNNPSEFFSYVNDPENVDRIAELLPVIAEPGYQHRPSAAVVENPIVLPEPDPLPASEPAAAGAAVSSVAKAETAE